MESKSGNAVGEPGEEEANHLLRIRVGNLFYRQREVRAKRHVLLEDEQVSAIGDIGQTPLVSQPRIRRIGRMSADLDTQRRKAF